MKTLLGGSKLKRALEGVTAAFLCFLVWLCLFLGGLNLVFPGQGRTWAYIRVNPLLLFLLQAFFLAATIALAVSIAWFVGRWLPFLRRGLRDAYREWWRISGRPRP